MIKIFQTQRWRFVPPSKVPNVKISVILVTLKTRSKSNISHAIKGLAIMPFRYKCQASISNGYLFVEICLSHWLWWENSTLTHKIQKWWCSDLILNMPCNIHLRCLQVWYGAPGPSGLNNYMPVQVKTHWIPLKISSEWPWQRLNWSCWCMLGRSSIDISTLYN